MRKTLFICLITFSFISVVRLDAREITLYRSINGVYKSLQEAEQAKGATEEITLVNGEYLIVSGWYERFHDAAPIHGKRNQKNQWKGVLPVDTDEDWAHEKGIEVKPTLYEKALVDHRSVIESTRETKEIFETGKEIVQDAVARGKLPDASTEVIINLLSSHEPQWLALTERSTDTKEAAFGRMSLGRLYYLQGLLETKTRFPRIRGVREPFDEATENEGSAYDSALEQFKWIVENAPKSEYAEDAAYHLASTQYHLTNRGHPIHQKKKAIEAYESFIKNFPNSERVPRAYLLLQGLTLGLARLGEAKFDDVIEQGKTLLSKYPQASEYIRGRATLMIAEAYHNGPHNEAETIKICLQILEEFADTKDIAIFGTTYRLLGYAYFFSEQFKKAEETFTIFLDGYSDSKYNYDYRVRDKSAAIRLWRGGARYLPVGPYQGGDRGFSLYRVVLRGLDICSLRPGNVGQAERLTGRISTGRKRNIHSWERTMIKLNHRIFVISATILIIGLWEIEIVGADLPDPFWCGGCSDIDSLMLEMYIGDIFFSSPLEIEDFGMGLDFCNFRFSFEATTGPDEDHQFSCVFNPIFGMDLRWNVIGPNDELITSEERETFNSLGFFNFFPKGYGEYTIEINGMYYGASKPPVECFSGWGISFIRPKFELTLLSPNTPTPTPPLATPTPTPTFDTPTPTATPTRFTPVPTVVVITPTGDPDFLDIPVDNPINAVKVGNKWYSYITGECEVLL